MGGPEGGPEPAAGVRPDVGAAAISAPSPVAGVPLREVYVDPGFEGIGGLVKLISGVGIPVGIGGTGGVPVVLGAGGPLAPLRALEGGPFGGGGGGAEAFSSSGPAFLFTHFPFSLSK